MKKIKIGVVLNYLEKDEVSGVRRSYEEKISGLLEYPKKFKVVLFVHPNMVNVFGKMFPTATIIKTHKNHLGKIPFIGTFSKMFIIKKLDSLLIKKEKCDVILQNGDAFYAPVTHDKNEILNIMDFNIFRLLKKGSFEEKTFRRKYKKFISKSNNIITLSEFAKQDILKFVGKYNGNIFVVHEAIEKPIKPKTKSKEDKPYILTINSFLKYKNQLTLVKAFDLIKDKVPYNLIMVGRPEIGYRFSGYDEIVEYIDKNNLNDRVIIKSFISDEERNNLLYNASLFVTTSTLEGFGRTPVEAMMCSVPTISTRETSLPEATMELAYYYNNPFDYKELADKILEIYNNRPSKSELNKIANKLIKAYNHSSINDKYISIFNKLMK